MIDGEQLLTKEELRQRLNLPSIRSVEGMIRDRKIPVIRIGWRTVRFALSDVLAALEKLTERAIE
jgi:excisionase family DNA binding protein